MSEVQGIFTRTEASPGNIYAPALNAKKQVGSVAKVLAASTAETVSIPTNAVIATFTPAFGEDFWVDLLGGTAVIPSADDATNPSILNPSMEDIGHLAGSTLSIIADGERKISIRFFGSNPT